MRWYNDRPIPLLADRSTTKRNDRSSGPVQDSTQFLILEFPEPHFTVMGKDHWNGHLREMLDTRIQVENRHAELLTEDSGGRGFATSHHSGQQDLHTRVRRKCFVLTNHEYLDQC